MTQFKLSKILDEPIFIAIIIITFSYLCLFIQQLSNNSSDFQYILNSFGEVSNQSMNSYILTQINVSHHLYPYLASTITITILIILIFLVAMYSNSLNSST